MPTQKPKVIRADDFVADSLEARADKIQGFEEAEAKRLLELAQRFRESGRPGMIVFWENAKEAEDFIRQEP